MSLVRAAWERRPEGPAYLLSICDAPISRRPVCFLMHTLTPLDQWNSERGFFPSSYDSGPDSSDCLQLRESSYGPEARRSKKHFSALFLAISELAVARVKNFYVFWVWLVVRSRDRATPPTM